MSLKHYLCHPVIFCAFVVLIFLLTYYVHKHFERIITQRLSFELNACNDRQNVIQVRSNGRQNTTAGFESHNEVQTQTEITIEHRPEADQFYGYTHETLEPSAPPLNPTAIVPFNGNYRGQDYDAPPPSYNEAVTIEDEMNSRNVNNLDKISGPNDLEWHQIFVSFNEKRMAFALHWTPVPSDRPLEKCLNKIENFLNAKSHPVSPRDIYDFIKSFVAFTNLVYTEIIVSDPHNETPISAEELIILQASHKSMFLNAFRLLLSEYVPKEPITNKKVPFGYDWFIYSGRMTYAIINAHIVLCAIDRDAPSTRPYFSKHSLVNTAMVVRALKNICQNFSESLGYERYSSNRVYIGTAFLYACLLEKAAFCITTVGQGPPSADGVLPDYTETLIEILKDPSNRYESFKTLIADIGKTAVPLNRDKGKNKYVNGRNIPMGAERGGVTYDGIYDDRTFFAHRRLRMYAYIRSYCEQLPSLQLLFREQQLDDDKISVLLRTVEPMSDNDAQFYFNLHSRTGGFKYRNGSALFAAMGLSKFRSNTIGTSYGQLYVADKARILFVQSGAFTFHSIGQLSDLAYGEVEKSNRDLMPAWLMGQRPLFRSEKNKLVDVPCSAHLEPCVIDTGKSKGLEMGLIKQRNTTDYTPTEASSALVAFEEQCIGAVFTSVREINMDVQYNRCTVATQYFTLVTYFHITRSKADPSDDKAIRLSCYTGCRDQGADMSTESIDKPFNFKHCTVQLFVQTKHGKPYEGTSVKLENTVGIEKRQKSKSKYTADQLKNVSLLLTPYGENISDASLPCSITILYRPKNSQSAPLPNSFQRRELLPSITVEDTNVYRIQLDARYVLYCDNVRYVMTLIDTQEKRACISPVCSSLQEDFTDVSYTDWLERATYAVDREHLGTPLYDTAYKNRLYAYFQK